MSPAPKSEDLSQGSGANCARRGALDTAQNGADVRTSPLSHFGTPVFGRYGQFRSWCRRRSAISRGYLPRAAVVWAREHAWSHSTRSPAAVAELWITGQSPVDEARAVLTALVLDLQFAGVGNLFCDRARHCQVGTWRLMLATTYICVENRLGQFLYPLNRIAAYRRLWSRPGDQQWLECTPGVR